MYLISEIHQREDVISLVIKELRQIGINVPNQNYKVAHRKRKGKHILRVPMENLDLEKALFSNGSLGEIPKFVSLCCKRLLQELEVEGLFRKSGSVKKQKAIIEQLEKCGTMDRCHNAIDIANILKTFFRDLPTPLIPYTLQEPLLRCLEHFNDDEMKSEAIFLLLLLLPPIAVNTLAYFLQFLKTVTKYSGKNLMTAENLVKVLTPTLMPLPHLNNSQQRLNLHFIVIEILLDKANQIGVVPERLVPAHATTTDNQKSTDLKRNKRRSGSLNRVFHGFRKIVNNIANSTEDLDATTSNGTEPPSTPFDILKSNNKRKQTDLLFSDRKKRRETIQILDPLPEAQQPSVKNDKIVDEKDRQDYVRVPKREYEAFKTRLTSIESKISTEFNMAKLENIKNDTRSSMSKFEHKLNETLHEVGKLEADDRSTDFLANIMSRDLKIRKSVDLSRSPSARKIGSLKRRRNVSLSRNLSWHMGQKESKKLDEIVAEIKAPDVNFMEVDGKSDEQRNAAENIYANVPEKTGEDEKKLLDVVGRRSQAPEKPIRLKLHNIDLNTPGKEPQTPAIANETWTPASDFFKSSTTDMTFKTPKNLQRKNLHATEFKTPMASPFSATPVRNYHTSNRYMMNESLFATPGSAQNTSAQGRESIIVLRNRLNGMVKSKIAALESAPSVSAPRPPPTMIINKNLKNVKSLDFENERQQQRDVPVRRSPRSTNRKSPMRPPVSRANLTAMKTIESIM